MSKLFTKEQIDGFNEEIASIGKYKLVSPINENPTDAEIICKRILYFLADIYDEIGKHEDNTLYDAGSIRERVESMESFINEMQLVQGGINEYE